MRKIIYHVAASLDNYIAHNDGTTRGFERNNLGQGDHVDEYLESLKNYDTAIMGRKTYEYGFQYGIMPGKAPYPHMRNYVFSRTVQYPVSDPNLEVIRENQIETIKELKAEEGTDIYLCGAGEFAGFLFENDLIDLLLIKLNPIILGEGIKLFGKSTKAVDLELLSSKVYDNGVMLLHYKIAK